MGLTWTSVLAESPSLAMPISSAEKRNPIEVYFATLSGLRYAQDDQLLSDVDIQSLIFSQGDSESSRLIKKSKSSGQLGVWSLGLGLVGITTGFFVTTDNVNDNQNLVTGLGIAFGGVCLSTAGSLLLAEGNSARFNAVQRYNHLAWSEDHLSASSVSGSSDIKIQPIDVRLTTFGGMGYSVDGRDMVWPKDFEDRIDSLNDFEASRLLKKSKSSGGLSPLFLGLGLAGEVATIIINSGSNGGGDRIGFWLPLIGSLLAGEIGAYLQMEANTAKFNAVKRYNRFARGQEQVLPQGPSDDKFLMDFSTSLEAPKKK